MPRVFTARPYREGAIGSTGNACSMILNQYQFPDTYEIHEKLLVVDHDRLPGYGEKVIKKHTGRGDMGLGSWIMNTFPQQGLDLIKDLFGVSQEDCWSGWRVLGSVHRGNGHAVWTLELFAKDPKSSTQVYSGLRAPNIEGGGRTLNIFGGYF